MKKLFLFMGHIPITLCQITIAFVPTCLKNPYGTEKNPFQNHHSSLFHTCNMKSIYARLVQRSNGWPLLLHTDVCVRTDTEEVLICTP